MILRLGFAGSCRIFFLLSLEMLAGGGWASRGWVGVLLAGGLAKRTTFISTLALLYGLSMNTSLCYSPRTSIMIFTGYFLFWVFHCFILSGFVVFSRVSVRFLKNKKLEF
jgi:hypothetical protein